MSRQEVNLVDSKKKKMLFSPDYNYIFDKVSGVFMRWGKTPDDDPDYSKFGPEIADIEISTICHKECDHCYKSNTRHGKYMSLETFMRVFERLPKTITQIAFGIGDIDGNPDLYKIMKHCRDNGVIPNITINGYRMKESDYENLAKYCGAVAVSYYDGATCYNTIRNLKSHGLHQVNMHMVLSQETYDQCKSMLISASHLMPSSLRPNAIVFLWLKPKGDRNTYHQVTKEQLSEFMEMIYKHSVSMSSVGIGFDSCSAPMMDTRFFEKYKDYIEPCESTLFSIYIDVNGKAYPCSFSTGEMGMQGIDMLQEENTVEYDDMLDGYWNIYKKFDFLRHVWNTDEFVNFRNILINNKTNNGCRKCPIYKLGCE